MDHSHGEHDHTGHGGGHGEAGHGGLGKYLAVFGALVVLTIISFVIGNSPMKETSPHAAWAAMMAVSVAKALLVMLFFMHLIWEANWKYVLTIPAGMMSIFLICMLIPDVGRRTHYYSPTRWLYANELSEKEMHGEQSHGDESHGDDSHAGEAHSDDHAAGAGAAPAAH